MIFKMRSLRGKMVKVGEIKGLAFYKHIQFSKHLYRKANALGLDVEVLQAIQAKGVVKIVLLDDESGRRFETPVERFLQKGWNYPEKGDQYYGRFQPQHFMALDRWTIEDGSHLTLQKGKPMEYEEAEARKKTKDREEKEKARSVTVEQASLFI